MENKNLKIGIIGLGLIGGSFALALKQKLNAEIYGKDKYFLDKAKDLGLIDFELDDNNLQEMKFVIIATPVDTIGKIAIELLDKISDKTLVFDTGSIKHNIAQVIENHSKRNQFLLAHPIAGTEYSGPDAAFPSLYENKINIICDTDRTRKDLLKRALEIFRKLNMQIIEMQSKEHDRHIAYVSHLSHISSFMLGKTVMDLEKDEKNIFQMAGSGFASTVRLAKSSPETWTPIFTENQVNILQALDEYIENLENFKKLLQNNKSRNIKELLTRTNHIKNIIDKIG